MLTRTRKASALAFVTITVWLLCAHVALGAEAARVVVFDTDAGPPPAGFVQALKIQLAARATVEPGASLSGALSERVEEVSRILTAGGANVGLWVERTRPDEDVPEFLVHVVSRRRDRVLVEIVRLPGTESPETDRALALKVSEVVNGVLRSQQTDLTQMLVAERAPPPAEAREPSVPAEKGNVALVLETAVVGASAGNGNGDEQLGLAAAVGLRLRPSGFESEGLARIAIWSGFRVENEGRRIDVRELMGLAAVRLLVTNAIAGGGVHAGAGARIVQAVGQSADGRTGETIRLVPVVALGPEARAMLASRVSLRAALGLELALRRQRFAAEDVPVLELGTLRAMGDIGVIIGLD